MRKGNRMTIRISWRVAYWLLLLIFIGTAILNMLRVKAGFFTSHAADLFLPPWMYVVLRHFPGRRFATNPITQWLGRSPELAAGSLFIASVFTELSQLYWPRGIFAGTFDPIDIVAYGSGLLVCYLVDKRQIRLASDEPNSCARVTGNETDSI
jgi:hypothetical protein